MIKRKIIMPLFCFILVCLTFVGCNNGPVVEMPNEPIPSFIETEIVNALERDEQLEFDKLSNFKINKVQVNDSDFETLKSKFAARVDYVKYETTFDIISVSMNISANYSAIFVYNNGQWLYSFGYITDKNSWEYEEKDSSRVDKHRMLSDLKSIEFTGFEKGYVGNIKNSSLGNILEREYNKTIHRDDIDVLVNVRTNFAEYEIPVKMIYYFNKGEWILGDVKISDVSEWDLRYDTEAPEEISNDVIIEYLTTDTYFLTYVCNKDYINGVFIEKVSELASIDSINTVYRFETVYNDIGAVSYLVDVSYQWLNQEWSDINVSVRDEVTAYFDSMNNKNFKTEDGRYITIKDIIEKEVGIYDIKIMFYDSYEQIELQEGIEVVGTLDIPLRDNNWDIIFENENVEDKIVLNLEKKCFIYNDMEYYREY